jgi:hypothetical protein
MDTISQVGFVALLASVLAGNTWADGYYHDRPHRHHPYRSVELGVYLGSPWAYPPYAYPYTVYGPQRVYLPPVVVSPPPVYIEQAPVPSAPLVTSPEAGYWYYCSAAQAYYPYVKQCPGAWQKVAPQPAQ